MRKPQVGIIPAMPDPSGRERGRIDDPRYMEGQRILVDAMKYLLQSDREGNRGAAKLLSNHVRARFRTAESPDLDPQRPDTLRAEFDALLDRMQSTAARDGMERAYNATPEQLGKAAVDAARKRGK